MGRGIGTLQSGIYSLQLLQPLGTTRRISLIHYFSLSLSLTLCLLGSIKAQDVTQDQPEMSVLEKEAVTLDCAYEGSSYSYYLFWYKQPPSGEMIFLLHQESYNELNKTEGRYFLNFRKKASSISLTITASQLEDSAVYFCALRDHSDAGACGSSIETSDLNLTPQL